MATAQELRKQIGSFRNTQKITRAMQMMAASKIKKAKKRMNASLPYSEKVLQVIGHVANAHPQYPHPFLQTHEKTKRVGFIVISSDRGLCGGLNANLFRYLLAQEIPQWKQQKADIDLCLINDKAINFFKHLNLDVVATANHVGTVNEQSRTDMIGAVRAMLNLYEEEKLDRLFVLHNEFITTMTQRPTILQLLPLVVGEDETHKHRWDYIYEPDVKGLLDRLLRRYIESQIYQAIVDNIACEEAARMVAMKSATDNAEDLIDELQLMYNKTRQAAITQEISEIVGGAAAV